MSVLPADAAAAPVVSVASGPSPAAAAGAPAVLAEPAAVEPAGRGSRLAHLPVTFFAVVMGLAGFSLAWTRAGVVLGAPPAVGRAFFWLALAVEAVVLAAYGTKLVRHPAAVRAELAHPVRLAFVPTASISLLLLAAAGLEVVHGLATTLWWVGAAGQLVATLGVLTAWINRPVFRMQHVSPAWFIPVVGTLTVPLAGVAVGPIEISWFFWSVGLVFWLVLLPLVMTRLFVHEAPLPAQLLPTLAILVAPPAIAFVALQRLEPGLTTAGQVLFSTAVFFALLFLAQLPTLRRLPFFLSWWAFAFPLAALAVATTIMAGLTGSAALEVAAWAALVLGTALVALLGVRTAGAALRGRICVPE